MNIVYSNYFIRFNGIYAYIWPRSFSTPLNSYRCRLGCSHSIVPLKLTSSLVSSRRAVAGTACRILRFVSPSKFDVSMKDMACGSLDDSITISAGKNALFIIRTISPTKRSCHLMATHCPLRSVSTSRWLISSSARCRFCKQQNEKLLAKQTVDYVEANDIKLLTKSSTNSLMALTAKMNINGTNVVYRPVGDTSGICWSKAMNKKKQFEYLRNCSNKNDGRKLIKLLERKQKKTSKRKLHYKTSACNSK